MAGKSAIQLAIFSGFLGSGSSVLAKLAGFYGIHEWWSLLWKLWLLGLMLLVNTLSLTLFSRALARSASSLAAVAGAAAVNYLCSTVVGWLVFDEPASLLRCTGIMVVLVGLVVMLKANSDTAEAKSSERKRKD
ncbi:uncharacterized protein LOC131667273 isoform X2 [Phymastichus coffea]|uniref:uncharacterized protein LOC131667273 isoform X2 n=1 Tax=Phymastichus coffea TaxID=108790 RepID=UPI00273C03CA|nr:uncharacterized protein LOC131667273 isoform X2 [Phymastichus coffea]XP_058796595.1 uncharacterized protein LOC131667273 isoform X2 [Phymastichus coffea]XP_058796596.1 uncharacterized protein LOC131667273 isoform X2 [Phymastichus coffea]XP_058796597.1 uncharacterized protein LOC131667273 isoform X2 [Phymastichus coffea]